MVTRKSKAVGKRPRKLRADSEGSKKVKSLPPRNPSETTEQEVRGGAEFSIGISYMQNFRK